MSWIVHEQLPAAGRVNCRFAGDLSEMLATHQAICAFIPMIYYSRLKKDNSLKIIFFTYYIRIGQ